MRVLRLVGFTVVLLVGLVVAIAAAFVLGVAADSIPLPDDIFDATVPRWMVGLVATVLLLIGLSIAMAVLPLRPLRLTLTGLAILGFLSTLTLLLLWVAAHAGDRVYVRFGGWRFPLPTNLTGSRIVAGVFAAGSAYLTLAAGINLGRSAWRALGGGEPTARA